MNDLENSNCNGRWRFLNSLLDKPNAWFAFVHVGVLVFLGYVAWFLTVNQVQMQDRRLLLDEQRIENEKRRLTTNELLIQEIHSLRETLKKTE